MESDTSILPLVSGSHTGSTRRSLLSLLGAGALAGSLTGLAMQELTEARKKKKGKKRKHKNRKKKGGKGGGGKSNCTGSVNGSAPASDEDVLLKMINDFRQQNGGLPALTRQGQLDSAAVAHSRDMVSRCFFDHINPDGADPGDRIAATGYLANAWAENIYKGSGNLGSAAEAFDAWQKSDGHRANMLNSDVTDIGIGSALDSADFMNWTNVFGRRSPG